MPRAGTPHLKFNATCRPIKPLIISCTQKCRQPTANVRAIKLKRQQYIPGIGIRRIQVICIKMVCITSHSLSLSISLSLSHTHSFSHTLLHMGTNIHANAYIQTHIHTYTCMHSCPLQHMQVQVHPLCLQHAYAYTLTPHIHTHHAFTPHAFAPAHAVTPTPFLHTHTYTHTHTHTHARTHTHAYTQAHRHTITHAHTYHAYAPAHAGTPTPSQHNRRGACCRCRSGSGVPGHWQLLHKHRITPLR